MKRKGRVSISVIEALSEGLYENILDIVREYVQNAYDAIGERFNGDYSKGLIQIVQSTKKNSLIIHDNGSGMSDEGLDTMVSIGFSTKSKSDVGFRGIGSLAGFTVAKKVIFISKDAASDAPWVLTIDADSIIRMCNDPEIKKNPILIDKAYDMFVEIEQASKAHTKLFEHLLGKESTGTTVILDEIDHECGSLLDKEELERYIARRLPVAFDPDFEYCDEVTKAMKKNVPNWAPVQVELNGENIYKVYKNDNADDDVVRKKVIKDDRGENLAFVWYTMRFRKKMCTDTRGLVTVVKGFTVLDAEQTISQILRFSTINHGYWVSGEIHIISPDVIPTTSRGNLKDNQAKHKLLKHFDGWSKELYGDIRERSELRSAILEDNKHVQAIQKQFQRYDRKTEKSLTTRADIYQVKMTLNQVEERTKELLRSIDRSHKGIVEELELTLEWVEDLRKKIRGKKPIATVERLGLKGKAKGVYTTIEKAILNFDFKKYSKKHDALRGELSSHIYKAVLKKVRKDE